MEVNSEFLQYLRLIPFPGAPNNTQQPNATPKLDKLARAYSLSMRSTSINDPDFLTDVEKFLKNPRAYMIKHLLDRLDQLTEEMISSLELNDVDHIVTVPSTHPIVDWLAKKVSNYFDISIKDNCINVHTNTKQRSLRSDSERQRNAVKKFYINPDTEQFIRGKKLLLIDDIYTSGATVENIGGKLIEAGASSVSVLTLAKARETKEAYDREAFSNYLANIHGQPLIGKLFIFDMDNTLKRYGKAITTQMTERLINILSMGGKVIIVSQSNQEYIEKLLGKQIEIYIEKHDLEQDLLSNLFLFSTSWGKEGLKSEILKQHLATIGDFSGPVLIVGDDSRGHDEEMLNAFSNNNAFFIRIASIDAVQTILDKIIEETTSQTNLHLKAA